jgi:hypothetical protein
MNDLDDRIRAALRAEDRELLDQLAEEPGLAKTIRDGYSGKWGWWMVVVSLVQTALFGLAIWTGIRFYQAETVDDRVFWAVWLILATLGVVQLKIMAWVRIQHVAVLREVKRLELQMLQLHRGADRPAS